MKLISSILLACSLSFASVTKESLPLSSNDQDNIRIDRNSEAVLESWVQKNMPQSDTYTTLFLCERAPSARIPKRPSCKIIEISPLAQKGAVTDPDKKQKN